MATCIGCGVSVGCGCQLTNGLCPVCINKQQPVKNVSSQNFTVQGVSRHPAINR
jgi:NMD protein affecting ribosome stability and mRNA decay